jgi:hypothetical protein
MGGEWSLNTPEQMKALRAIVEAAFGATKDLGPGFAIVAVLPDGAIAGSLIASDAETLATLMMNAPKCMRATVDRMAKGLGVTEVILEGDR